ncbi:MAG: hypothetical protein DMG06_29460 [Acidobacteria bacterium]|nr:MAG: hypothetical protein DMG06_29460 [Acidobacteriota bacterium]
MGNCGSNVFDHKFRYPNAFLVLSGGKISGTRPWLLAFLFLLVACRQANEISNLHLQDFIQAYRKKRLFQKTGRGLAPIQACRSRAGVRFFRY